MAELSNAIFFRHAERKFHILRVHADHGQIEESFVSEGDVSAHRVPIRIGRGETRISHRDLESAADGLFINKCEVVEQRRFRDLNDQSRLALPQRIVQRLVSKCKRSVVLPGSFLLIQNEQDQRGQNKNSAAARIFDGDRTHTQWRELRSDQRKKLLQKLFPLMKMSRVSRRGTIKNQDNFEIPTNPKKPEQNRIGASLGDRQNSLCRYLMLGTTPANLNLIGRLMSSIQTSRFHLLKRIAFFLLLLLFACPILRAQDAVRPSLAGEASAESRRQSIDKIPYNLLAGPIRFRFSATFGVEYNDNINLAEVNKQDDFIIRPSGERQRPLADHAAQHFETRSRHRLLFLRRSSE